jgi:cupin 2 domain-containing protein
MTSATSFWADLPSGSAGVEVFEEILKSENVRIERISSSGQISPENFWYDQPENEWVILLQGEAIIGCTDGVETRLGNGDYLFLPAHQKHRVVYTSREPPCIWLAVFWKT